MEFSYDDVGKTFVYTMQENDTNDDGIQYDRHVETVIITITGDDHGNTSATVNFDSGVEKPEFVNVRTVDMPRAGLTAHAIWLLPSILAISSSMLWFTRHTLRKKRER